MNTEQQIRDCLNELPRRYNDPSWLSECAIQLSSLLFNLADDVAEARTQEEAVVIGYIDQIPTENSKRMSKTEAESRGVVDTHDAYERLKLKYQSVVETINSIKKRLDSQSQLLKSGV